MIAAGLVILRALLARAGFRRTAGGYERPARTPASSPSRTLRRPLAHGRVNVLGAALRALGLDLGPMTSFRCVAAERSGRFCVDLTVPASRLAVVLEGPAPRERRFAEECAAAIRAVGWTPVRVPHRSVDNVTQRWRVALDVALLAARGVCS